MVDKIKHFFNVLKVKANVLIALEKLFKILFLVIKENAELSVQVITWIYEKNLQYQD